VAFEVGHEAALDDLQNIYMPAARNGDLKIRLRAFVSLHVWEPLVEMIRVFGTRENRLSFGSVKEFFDGSLSSRTAYMHKEYIDDAGNRGIRTVNLSQFESQLFDAHRAGLQIGIHAIGSQAVDEVVSYFQKVHDADLRIFDESQRAPFRHRIEHAQHLSSWDVLDKMKNIGIQVTPNPLHMKSDLEIIDQRLGSEEETFAYAFGKFASHHINMGLASDWPVADMDPWATLVASMDPSNDHSLSFTQALHYVTRGAAQLGDIDEDIGMIAPGMLADFVIHSCDESNRSKDGRIPGIDHGKSIPTDVKHLVECRSGVRETYVQGECVYGCTSTLEE
jgi:predicted amidohydrolase YtcJ